MPISKALNARAARERRKELDLRRRADGLRGLADAAAHKGLELEMQARRVQEEAMPGPKKPWGSLEIMDGANAVELARSADPDAVARAAARKVKAAQEAAREAERQAEAARQKAREAEREAEAARETAREERVNQTRAAAESRIEAGKQSKKRVAELWPKVWSQKTANGRKTNNEDVAGEVAAQLTAAGFKISSTTVKRIRPK
jgi:hypothetical protein